MRTLGSAVVCVVLCGCSGPPSDSPETVPVSGTVTLDGQPLPDASVRFMPAPGAAGGGDVSPAYGMTNSSGEYEMEMTMSQSGVVPGKYNVVISTYQEPDPDEGTAAVPEKVPTKYNSQTELTADVVAGQDTYDFPLSTEGAEIVQPDPESSYDDE